MRFSRRSFLAGCGVALAAPSELEQADVFVSGQDGYHTYRIPALIVGPGGTLLAFCEGRKNSARDHGNIDLLLKTSRDRGRTWSPQRIVHEEGRDKDVTIGNPCPVVDQKTRTLWLPFCRNNDRVFLTSSRDDGQTWASPRDITEAVKRPEWGWYATGPGVGIQLTMDRYRGRLVIPCDHGEMIGGKRVISSHVIFSDDRGGSWQLGGILERYTDECQVVELRDGRLLLNMRNHLAREAGRPEQGGRRAIAYSSDGGATWSPRRFDETLIEPVCQASLIRHGKWLVFSNPADPAERSPHDRPAQRGRGPDVAARQGLVRGQVGLFIPYGATGGEIGCLHERGSERYSEKITFARLSLDSLRRS